MTLSARDLKAREEAILDIVSEDPWLSSLPATKGKRSYIQRWDEKSQSFTCTCECPHDRCWHLKDKVQPYLAAKHGRPQLHVVH